MRNSLTIASREIRSSFVTPLAYAVFAGFLVLSAFFFFSLLQQFNTLVMQSAMLRDVNTSLNEWVITPYYQTLEIVLIFLIPVLTMRVVAEEKRSGTFELLATSPISVAELVLGKFLGVAFVTTVMLLLSFLFPLVLINFADPETLPVFVGFLGVLLFSLAYVAIGVAVSSCTKSQTVAGVISLVTLLVLYIVDAPADKIGGTTATVLKYLAPSSHTEMFTKGVLAGADIVYFLSLIVAGLFVANRVLDAQRWR